MRKLNNHRGQASTSISPARRIASLAAGFAILTGVLLAASPARAEDKLTVEVSVTGLKATISASGCPAEAPSAEYSIQDAQKNRVVSDTPVPGWKKGDTSFTFTWTAPKSGTYRVSVFCMSAAKDVRIGEKDFTVAETAKTKPVMLVNRTTWPVTSKVTLTAKGLKPGEDAKFYLADPTSLDAHEVWETKANASGVATVTVTLPTESQYPSSQGMTLEPGDYELGVTADSLAANAKITVWRRADGTWSTQGQGPKGTLPKTGD